MARTTPRTLAALAGTARQCLAALVPHGIGADPLALTALDQVERFARGDTSVRRDLAAASTSLFERSRGCKAGVKSAAWAQHWLLVACSNLCLMAASGDDGAQTVREQLGYGGLGVADAAARVDAWYAAAVAAAADVSSEPAPRKPPSAARVAAEQAALARAATALGRQRARLAASGARHDPRRTAARAVLAKLLAKHRYPRHAAVFAFEAAFGGLIVPDEIDADGGIDDAMATLVGAYACLRSGAHVHPDGGRAGLVPVAYTADDGILFLDAGGKPYFQDTIADVRAKAFGASAAAAVARLLRA